MLRLTSWFVLLASSAVAQAPESRFSAGGYYRIMARPDFQGGNGRLGFWNLYGRLMNEGPWAALEMQLDLLQAPPGTTDIWASLHGKLEGGSVSAADSGNGSFLNFRVSQLYAQAGNIIAPDLVWQLGTLHYLFGDLGLYDFRLAQLFDDTIGLSARWSLPSGELLVAIGDSGFSVRGARYVPLLTSGFAARIRLGERTEVGLGGQLAVEPFISGNRNSSYVTPGLVYEQYLRKEVLQRYVEEHPLEADRFPLPVPSSQLSTSYRLVAYLGFGKLGPLIWNNAFLRYQLRHPEHSYEENYQGRTVTIYTADVSRQRSSLQVGDELQLRLVKDRLDVVLAGFLGLDRNPANTLSAGEDNRQYWSTVARLQGYVTSSFHLLLEGSVAQERSLNGNLYRTAFDSIFQNTRGVADTRGLEVGDSAVRHTVQVKTGVVLNPKGLGIYARPSIRLLYGVQYSTQHAAFGNAFVERLDQFDAFKPSATIAWHHLVSLESEGWF